MNKENYDIVSNNQDFTSNSRTLWHGFAEPQGSEEAIMKNTGLEHEEFEATFEIKWVEKSNSWTLHTYMLI